jgi:CheY-like chemotaxis protein/nitrogen-specific signal transduction histidine kinase
MTDRRAVQEAEREARDAAERANRVKSEFLSGMSHELRTPLNAVLGFAQILELDELTPTQSDAVTQIRKAGELLLNLVDELLDISRIEAERMTVSLEPVHVGELLRECFELIDPIAAEHRVSIVGPPTRERIYVTADQQRLKQVVMNLLSNAVKFNRPDGLVTIQVQALDEHVTISVIDTGNGIGAADLKRLFVPFERLDAAQGGVVGTGLGLALSERLMALMHGSITVESTLGRGSTFKIKLPRTDGPDLTASEEASGPATSTVLYIEDNLANQHLVELLLSRMGTIEVMTAMQGQIGLELARTHRPDLILLDLHLPDMDGEDVARVLLDDAATRDIPIVVLSADAYSSVRRRLLALGVQGYVTKPFKIAEMTELVERLLAE